MSILKICKYPDPILKKKLSPVKDFDKELRNLVGNMFETMYYSNGVGLAANQVGRDLRLIVIDTKRDKPIVMINPEIIFFSKEKDCLEEGCLSVPNYFGKVKRSKKIIVSYYDINARNVKLEVDEILARVIQHEVDHINGIIFIEKLPILNQIRYKITYNKK